MIDSSTRTEFGYPFLLIPLLFGLCYVSDSERFFIWALNAYPSAGPIYLFSVELLGGLDIMH